MDEEGPIANIIYFSLSEASARREIAKNKGDVGLFLDALAVFFISLSFI